MRTHILCVMFLLTADAANVFGQAEMAGRWTIAAALPTARSECAGTEIAGRVYVAGGIGRFGTSDAFEMYDPARGSWASLPPLPETLHHAAVAGFGGDLYLTGGYQTLRFRNDVRSAWRYRPGDGTWAKLADMPAPRAAHAMVATQNRIIVVGGVGPAADNLWAYDPETDTWSTLREKIPTPREHLAAIVIEDDLYVIGGRDHEGNNFSIVEIFNLQSDTWRRAPDMPSARSGFAAARIGTQIHVVGGEEFDPNRTIAEHEVYDPAKNTWSTSIPLPVPRHGIASAVIDDTWYVMGGASGAGLKTFVTFTSAVDAFKAPQRQPDES